MGANAQTTVPTFVASQVLTADQQNQSARTGVPVFASTGDRDAAFGGTGEKTLAEGQLCYVEGTGLQTYNAGGSWVTWGEAPTPGGLVLVQAETAFSAVSSVTVDNVFTSTYTSYRVILNYQTSTTNDILYRNRVGGVSAATNYNDQNIVGINTTITGGRAATATSNDIAAYTNGAFWSSGVLDIHGPQLAQATTIVNMNSVSFGGYNLIRHYTYAHNHSTATAYDGFELFVATGTMTGNYTVFGYRKI